MKIVIVGAGEVGYNLAKMLCYEHHDIVIIEKDAERIKRAQDHLDVKILSGSGTDFDLYDTVIVGDTLPDKNIVCGSKTLVSIGLCSSDCYSLVKYWIWLK